MRDTQTMAQWDESPFTSHDRRGDVIQHRVVVEHHGGVGADVRHEVRSTDSDKCPDEWTEVDALELRDHGMLRTKADGQEWWA